MIGIRESEVLGDTFYCRIGLPDCHCRRAVGANLPEFLDGVGVCNPVSLCHDVHVVSVGYRCSRRDERGPRRRDSIVVRDCLNVSG